MSVELRTLIEATTALAYSQSFTVVGTGTITAGPLATGEGVQLQICYDGTNWTAIYLNAVLQEITDEHLYLSVTGPMKLRCLKSVTASACSVHLWEQEQPI